MLLNFFPHLYCIFLTAESGGVSQISDEVAKQHLPPYMSNFIDSRVKIDFEGQELLATTLAH